MKHIIGILILTVYANCYAQSEIIEYAFSKEVTNEIRNYINEGRKDHPENTFYCVLSKGENNGYILDIQYYALNKSGNFTNTIKNSNRYLLIDNLKVPVLFEFDLVFVSYGKDQKGRHLRSYNIFEHPYRIEFDRKGEVLKKGFSQ